MYSFLTLPKSSSWKINNKKRSLLFSYRQNWTWSWFESQVSFQFEVEFQY